MLLVNEIEIVDNVEHTCPFCHENAVWAAIAATGSLQPNQCLHRTKMIIPVKRSNWCA
jgi:ribosomal protein L37AE/L43A